MDNIKHIRVCTETQVGKSCKDQIEALFGDAEALFGDSSKEEPVDDQKNYVLTVDDDVNDQKMKTHIVDFSEVGNEKTQLLNVVKETHASKRVLENLGEGIDDDGSHAKQVEMVGVVQIGVSEENVATKQVLESENGDVEEEIVNDDRCEVIEAGSTNGDENVGIVNRGIDVGVSLLAEDRKDFNFITEMESSLLDKKENRENQVANGGQRLDSQLPMACEDHSSSIHVVEFADLLPVENMNKDQKVGILVFSKTSDITHIPEESKNAGGSVIEKDEIKDVQVSVSNVCISDKDQIMGTHDVQIVQTHVTISQPEWEAGSHIQHIENQKGGNIVIDLGTSLVDENQNTSNEVTGMGSKGGLGTMVGRKPKEAGAVSVGKKIHASHFQDQENQFSVGDLVWGKVRSHPWWPGQIFDPSYSSEKASKYQKKDNFLVAYFGDRTFAWCDKTQLKPFGVNFRLMERQGSTDAFLNAVNSALDEVSRRVELGLACRCLPESANRSLKCQEVINAGIREGVTVADIVDKSFTVTSFEPNRFFEYIRELALFTTPEGVSILEFTVVVAQLTAYYRAKGYLKLPQFHVFGGLLSDAEFALPNRDSSENIDPISVNEVQNSMNLDSEKRVKKIGGSPSWKRKHILDDGLHRSRKQKSLTELMAEKKARRLALNDGRARAGKMVIGKSVSPSVGTKKYKKTKDSFSAEAPRALNGTRDQDGKRVTSKSVSPSAGTKRNRWKKRKSIASLSDPVIEAPTTLRSFKDSPSSQNSKKKKMLDLLGDPDYQIPTSQKSFKDDPFSADTSGDRKKKKVGVASSGDADIKTPRTRGTFKLGECISRIANQLTGSPPILKVRDRRESFRKNAIRVKRSKINNKASSVGTVTPQTPEKRRKISIPKESFTPNEMLSQLCLTARDPMKGYNFLSVIIGFFSGFRDLICQDDSGSGKHKKSHEKTGGKSGRRKSSNSKTKLIETFGDDDMNDSYWTDRIIYSSPEEPVQRTRKRRGEFKLQSPTKKQNRENPSLKPAISPKLDTESEAGAEITLQSPTKKQNIENPSSNPVISPKLNTESEPGAEKQVENSGEKNENSPTTLILTFAEADSIPSETDLCKIFNRYGALKESETEVLRKTKRARVVFERRSDAEVAFSSAGKFSIFGPALVSYRLRYSYSPLKAASTKPGWKDGALTEGKT